MLARSVVLALCAFGALAAVVAGWRHGRELASLQALAREAGADADSETLMARIARESDARFARVITARALTYHVINVRTRGAGTADLQRADAALPKARALTHEVLKDQPASWQAAMLLGTGHYLEWSLKRDRRLYTAAATWEKPLDGAVARSGHPEPQRLLATVYLETWAALSPAKKDKARELLREVFRTDFRAFQALSPAWLETRGSLEEKLAVMPAEPRAWAELERFFAGRHDWRSLQAAFSRHSDALLEVFERRRLEAGERLALGDYYNGRALLLQNLVEAPRSRRFLPEVAASLELYPPGLHGLATTEALREWLEFLLELDRVDVRPLEPALMGRLLDAAGELPPEVGAHAALLAGDIYQAERYERLTDSFQLDGWGPYLVAKARWAIGRQDADTARNSLDLASIGWRRQLPYLVVRRELETSRLAGATLLGAPPVDTDLFRRVDWPASAWRTLEGRSMLELWAPRAARGFSLEIDEAPDYGTVIELLLDGQPLGLATVNTGDRLTLTLPISSRLHQLAIRPLVTAEVVPGALRLLD